MNSVIFKMAAFFGFIIPVASGRSFAITVDNEFTLYIDGVKQPILRNNRVPQRTDTYLIPDNTHVVAVHGIDGGYENGILASTDDGFIQTNSSWKCTDVLYNKWFGINYDDSHWPFATEIQPNYENPLRWSYFAEITNSAQWIWTANSDMYSPYGDGDVYCRFDTRGQQTSPTPTTVPSTSSTLVTDGTSESTTMSSTSSSTSTVSSMSSTSPSTSTVSSMSSTSPSTVSTLESLSVMPTVQSTDIMSFQKSDGSDSSSRISLSVMPTLQSTDVMSFQKSDGSDSSAGISLSPQQEAIIIGVFVGSAVLITVVVVVVILMKSRCCTNSKNGSNIDDGDDIRTDWKDTCYMTVAVAKTSDSDTPGSTPAICCTDPPGTGTQDRGREHDTTIDQEPKYEMLDIPYPQSKIKA